MSWFQISVLGRIIEHLERIYAKKRISTSQNIAKERHPKQKTKANSLKNYLTEDEIDDYKYYKEIIQNKQVN